MTDSHMWAGALGPSPWSRSDSTPAVTSPQKMAAKTTSSPIRRAPASLFRGALDGDANQRRIAYGARFANCHLHPGA